MAKGKVSVTIDHAVLEAADADAQAAGLNRPEIFERALRNEHLRRSLTNTPRTRCRRSTSTLTRTRFTGRTGPLACDHPRRHPARRDTDHHADYLPQATEQRAQGSAVGTQRATPPAREEVTQ